MNYLESFATERYNTVSRQIMCHRIDTFIREVEARPGKNKGNIMSFVRGLRLSALIIYQIREILSGSELSAYWGQIIDENSQYLSNECDIIISKKDAQVRKWNGQGNGDDVMDFRFIKKEHAVAVISCKSFITKEKIEEEYCENLLKFVDNVWLFAECCGPKSVEIIANESLRLGYKHFWHLYTWNRDTGETEINFDRWKHFEQQILSLVK